MRDDKMIYPQKCQLEGSGIEVVICWLVSTLILYEIPFFYNKDNVGLYLSSVTSFILVIFPWFPAFFSFPITALYVVLTLSRYSNSGLIFFAQLVVLGILAYRRKWAILFVNSLLVVVSASASWLMLQDDISSDIVFIGLMNYLIFIILVIILGILVSQKEQEARIRSLQKELEKSELIVRERERDVRIAGMLHDSLSGKLTLVSYICDSLTLNKSDDLIDQINQISQDALLDLRSAIDVLRGENASQGRWCAFDYRMLLSVVKEHEEALSKVGFTGEVNVEKFESGMVDVDSKTEFLRFLDEVFANIVRHGSNGSQYILRISIHDGMCSLFESNLIGENVDTPGGVSGRGLSYHKKSIEDAGGVFSSLSEEGEWILYTRFPFTVYAPLHNQESAEKEAKVGMQSEFESPEASHIP